MGDLPRCVVNFRIRCGWCLCFKQRPEPLTAESANSKFKMIQLQKRLKVGEEGCNHPIGMKERWHLELTKSIAALAKISSEDQVKLMDDMIKKQPASSDASDDKQTFFSQMMKILRIMAQFSRGTGMTPPNLYDWNYRWLIIGLLIGVFRTAPKAKINSLLDAKLPLVGSSMSTLKSSVEPRWSFNPWSFSTVPPKPLTFPWIEPGPPSLSYPSIPELIWWDCSWWDLSSGSRSVWSSDCSRNDPWTNHAQGRPSTGCSQYLASNREWICYNIKETSVLNVISVVELYFYRKYGRNSKLPILPNIYDHRCDLLRSHLYHHTNPFYIERRLDSDTYTTGANQMQVNEVK